MVQIVSSYESSTIKMNSRINYAVSNPDSVECGVPRYFNCSFSSLFSISMIYQTRVNNYLKNSRNWLVANKFFLDIYKTGYVNWFEVSSV